MREVQAFIRIKREGGGEVQFGLVSGQSDGEVVKTAAGERFEFTWEGNDECEPASGSGWLALTTQNELEGKIKFTTATARLLPRNVQNSPNCTAFF